MLFKILQIGHLFDEWIQKKAKIKLRGLGKLSRYLRKDRWIDYLGIQLFFDHRCADNYIRLTNGRFNEPETHAFLAKVIHSFPGQKFNFIDVGANVGEFIFNFGHHNSVVKVYAFEPQPIQFEVLKSTVQFNRLDQFNLINKAVSDRVQQLHFDYSQYNSTRAGISDASDGNTIITTTLDQEITDVNAPVILLIDVEGHELRVMQGGRGLIRDQRPLIIFEFNMTTKKSISLHEIQEELGADYQIFQLVENGQLLSTINDNTWNLVAIHADSTFAPLIAMQHASLL